MTITAERGIDSNAWGTLDYPVAAATKLFAGELAALDASGNLIAATGGAGTKSIGYVRETVDNLSGAAGALKASINLGKVYYGTYVPLGSVSPPSAADTFKTVYADASSKVTTVAGTTLGTLLYVLTSEGRALVAIGQ